MPSPKVQTVTNLWKSAVTVAGWVLTLYGLNLLTAGVSTLTKLSALFPDDLPNLTLSRSLAGVTLLLLLMWILHAVINRRGISLRSPLILLAVCSAVMTLLLINATKSFGPFMGGCSAYPPLSFICEPSFDDVSDFYLLALLSADMLLLLRFFLELLPIFEAKVNQHPDILDRPDS